MQFRTEEDLYKWLDIAYRDAQTWRAQVRTKADLNRLLVLGCQWSTAPNSVPLQFKSALAGYQTTREIPGPIRAVVNRMAPNVIRVAAALQPESLSVDALPPVGSSGAGSAEMAHGVAYAANAATECGWLVEEARNASFERVIAGLHGLGWRIAMTPDATSRRLEAFDFDASDLILDPNRKDRDLRRHDFVGLSSILTLEHAKRLYGEKAVGPMDNEKAPTIASVAPAQVTYGLASGGLLYPRLAAAADRKCVVTLSLFFKGRDGRFDRMYLCLVQPGTGQRVCINFQNPDNPFGGCGMPLGLLRGHRRPGGALLAISDADMMRDDQTKLNIVASVIQRQLRESAQRVTRLIPAQVFKDADPGRVRTQLESGVVVMDGRADRDTYSGIQQLVHPGPDYNLWTLLKDMEDQVRTQASISDFRVGRLKSHVTNEQAAAASASADLPHDQMLGEDIKVVYEPLIQVGAGTVLRMLNDVTPDIGIVRTMLQMGASERTIGTLAEDADPYAPPARLTIPRDSLSPRSKERRRAEAAEMAAAQQMSAPEYRYLLAEPLGMPATPTDRLLIRRARTVADRVLRGAAFQPEPLGPVGMEFMVIALREALVSDEAERVEGGADRLRQAIAMQEAAMGMAAQAAAPEARAGSGDPAADFFNSLTPAAEAVA